MEPNNLVKKIISIIILIGILLLFGYVIYNMGNYVSNLEQQVRDRDLLIRRLAESEALINEYFDIKQDSLTEEKIYILKPSKQKNVTIVNETDCDIFKMGDTQINADELVARYNTILHDYVDIVEKYNSKIDEKQKLVVEYNSIVKQYNKALEYESYNNALKKVLDLIYKNYEISYNIEKEDNIYKINISTSAKIDSALMLLPTYRNKLRYNEKNKEWTIRRW